MAAIAYGVGTIWQAQSVAELRAVPAGAGFAVRLRASRRYLAGLAIDGAGFLAALVAFRDLPLFVVESAIASSVAVTALLSVLLLDVRLSAWEWTALLAVAAGLAALGSAAEPGPVQRVPDHAGMALLGGAVVFGLALAGGAIDASRTRAAITLSATAGLSFGVLGMAARLLVVPPAWWHLVGDPAAWALVVSASVGMVAYGIALDRGRINAVAAITFTAETVLPAMVGVLWLGDAVRPGMWGIAVAGFTATLAGCIALAGRAEPHPEEASASPAATP